VTDASARACEGEYSTPHGAPVEVAVFALREFERVGLAGSSTEWDRYSYAGTTVVLDKLDGVVSALVAQKGTLSDAEARRLGRDELGAYFNSCYRSLRNFGGGRRVEGLLDAAESVPLFLTGLFALHRRIRPFNKFLVWELERHPLGAEVWSAELLVPRLERIVAGAAEEQRALFRDAERLAREHGLGAVVDAWEPDVAFLRGECD
jgi:hypothetical protein